MKNVLSLLLILFALTSCSDDEPQPIPSTDKNDGYSYDANADLLGGEILFYITLSDMENFQCPIEANEPIAIETYGNPPFTLDIVKIDTIQYVVPRVITQLDDPFVVIAACAHGLETGTWRNFILVVRNDVATESVASAAKIRRNASSAQPLLPVYSSFLGKGTLCFNELGNITRSVLLYNALPLDDENFITTGYINQVNMTELEGETFKSTMESWSFNVGMSWSGIGIGNRPWSMSGAINFGMNSSVATSDDYEYYMNLLKVERAEMKLNTSEFESMAKKPEKAKNLFGYIANGFIDDIFEAPNQSFDYKSFYNKWGTDIIQQGTVGGYNIYLYGREENTYEHSIGVDASLSLKGSKNASTTGKEWLDIYLMNNSPYIKGDLDFSYKNDNYFKASRSQSVMKTVGGNPVSDNNAEQWIKGFENIDDNDKWQLISYRRPSDAAAVQKDSVWLLYPIENMIENIVTAYENIFAGHMSSLDSAIVYNARANLKTLIDNKQAYVNYYTTKPEAKSRLVLCDLMMKYNKERRKSGQPEPFVAADPRNPTKYRTYYPMMANKHMNNSSMQGKAIDTNDNYFVTAVHNGSHYWYYTMAHEDDCDGIVGIEFSEKPDNYYVLRGDDARTGTGGLLIKKRRVCIKYFDPMYDETNSKITAFGIYDEKQNQIIASTGGAELSLSANQSETERWTTFWDSTESKNRTSVHFYAFGGAEFRHYIRGYWSTKDLPITQISASTVTHPQTW